MTITQIKQQVKNPDRVSIFVDGKYSFSLTLDQLLSEKLKKDIEIDEARLKALKKLSEEGKLRARTLEWVLRRPHSTKELRDYLFKKQVEKDLREDIITDMVDKKYINDQEFARWFADNRMRKNKSTREISAELTSKGISKEIASDILQSDEALSEVDRLKALVEKLKNRSRYQEQEKLIAYLQRKGFKYSDIKDVLREYE